MPARQVELGNLLDMSARRGFQVRVTIIAQPADLGAVTALWRKPAAYASFLGIELSLAYKQRLLVVMPGGLGFNWPGHPAASASQVLSRVAIGPGGSDLAAGAQAAVLALAEASGVRLPAPRSAGAAAPGPAAGVTAGQGPANSKPRTVTSGTPAVLIMALMLAALAAGAVTARLARRKGLRLPSVAWPPDLARQRARLRLPAPPVPLRRVPATWLASALVIAASTGIVVHALLPGPPPSSAQGSLLADNPALDPGTTLSGSAPDFTLTDQFGQPASLRSYRGKVVILAFDDSEYTTICPLTTTAMLYAKSLLGAAGPGVQLLGIDANPKPHRVTFTFRWAPTSLPQEHTPAR
jgi:hypothetical protein